MPVVGEAGNRITWNHFFFVGGGTSMIRTCQGKTELSLHSEELPEAPL
jgi:hypothetical protein